MKAIITKYLSATNFKGSRIKASDGDKNTIIISYPGELDTTEAHRKAAYVLKEKMKWPGELIGGGLGNDYVWVFKD